MARAGRIAPSDSCSVQELLWSCGRVNAIGFDGEGLKEIIEDERIEWGKVDVVIFTHKIKGLSESDYILGAKIDRLYFQPR